ncbi:MAG: TetR/AcrR family transcriptional regulator [Actinobacteria bacterium]|nr:MAG: TetR/AcrR family transcriptional regulator [Actinomycetota bacterium]
MPSAATSAARGDPRAPRAEAHVGEAPHAETHRERLLAAMASSIEEKGFRDTAVADVVRAARTSRRTFYEHFSDREDCFLALFEATTAEMMRGVASAVQSEAPWEEQVEVAVGRYFDSVAARPALFRSFVRELPALGWPGADRQRAVTERFADTLVVLAESGSHNQGPGAPGPLSRDAATIIVGGLRELTVSALEQRRDIDELRASAAQIVKAIIAAAAL